MQAYLPLDLAQTEEMNLWLAHHYHYQRPHQGLSCGNQPPRLAFPNLPPLPPLPDPIDPDHWLNQVDGQTYRRQVNAAGAIRIDKQPYYLGRQHQGRTVVVQVHAEQQAFQVHHHNQLIKTLPIKGLHQTVLPFEDYLTLLRAEAVSQWRLYLRRYPHYRTLAP